MKDSKKNKFLTLRNIIILAVGVRSVLFGLVSEDYSRSLAHDTPGYMILADNYKAVYWEGYPEFRNASLLRTPGYPTFLAFCNMIGGKSIFTVLIMQTILSVGTTIIVYIFAKFLFEEQAALWAALLMAIGPLGIACSFFLLTEALFTSMITLGVMLWVIGNREVSKLKLFLSGGILGLATLVRPISLYLPCLLLLVSFALINCSWNYRVFLCFLFICGFSLPVGGWIARNVKIAGAPMLSSIEGTNILYFRAAGAIAEETGESRKEVASKLKIKMSEQYGFEDTRSFWDVGKDPQRFNSLHKQVGLRILLQHPRGLLISILRGLKRLIAGHGFLEHKILRIPENGLLKDRIISIFTGGWLWGVYFGGIVGVVRMIQKKEWNTLLMLGVIIAYLSLISAGPEAYSRFRAPLMPFIFILTGFGISELFNRVQKQIPLIPQNESD